MKKFSQISFVCFLFSFVSTIGMSHDDPISQLSFTLKTKNGIPVFFKPFEKEDENTLLDLIDNPELAAQMCYKKPWSEVAIEGDSEFANQAERTIFQTDKRWQAFFNNNSQLHPNSFYGDEQNLNLVWIAKSEDQKAVARTGFVVIFNENKPVKAIVFLHIHPDFQRQGLGEQLISKIKELDLLGSIPIVAVLRDQNEAAEKLLLNNDFQKSGGVFIYQKDL